MSRVPGHRITVYSSEGKLYSGCGIRTRRTHTVHFLIIDLGEHVAGSDAGREMLVFRQLFDPQSSTIPTFSAIASVAERY
jgi:allantoicase